MERRIARVSVLSLVFSMLPWLGFVLAAAVAGLVPADFRAVGVSVGVVSWLGSTLLASFAVVTIFWASSKVHDFLEDISNRAGK